MAFQDFDLISQRRQEERKRKKKRIVIAVVTVLVLLLVAGAAVGVFLYKNNQDVNKEQNNKAPSPKPKPVNAAEKAVKTACAGTDYKKTCEDSLQKAVKKDSHNLPEDILKASFSVTSQEIEKAVKQTADLKCDSPMKKKALEDCQELLNNAKEELETSVSSVKGKDLGKLSSVKDDINNWLSAVLSYQQTCIDGFPDGEEKTAMEKALKTAKEHASNALAIVSQASSLQSKLKSLSSQRKLLAVDEAGFPTWMNQESRRLLKADAAEKYTPNVTVAKDGSGNFSTITEALNAMPENYTGRYFIYVKGGIYEESVNVTQKMVNVTMYGDGSQKSIVTGSKSYVDGIPPLDTATFAVLGDGFVAQSLGFRNTAGADKHQAVALRVQADHAIFVNCRMEGYQAVLLAQAHRQFYRSCYITGTMDIILGDATAVFQNCMIYLRKGVENQNNTVTAQGRIDKRETTGFVLHNCRILADDQLEPEKAKFKSYLGRPWQAYSRTVVMESEISDVIQPEGWVEWMGNFGLKTLFFAEYNNKGAGANTDGRVKWEGYKASLTKEEASEFTVAQFLQGESWLKNSDVPVRYGMFN